MYIIVIFKFKAYFFAVLYELEERIFAKKDLKKRMLVGRYHFILRIFFLDCSSIICLLSEYLVNSW